MKKVSLLIKHTKKGKTVKQELIGIFAKSSKARDSVRHEHPQALEFTLIFSEDGAGLKSWEAFVGGDARNTRYTVEQHEVLK